jgi:hypothetical protein
MILLKPFCCVEGVPLRLPYRQLRGVQNWHPEPILDLEKFCKEKFMAKTNVSIRMDTQLKDQFETFCNNVGLTMSTAFNVLPEHR